MHDLSNEITECFKKLSLEYTNDKINKLNDYVNLLDKWNKAFNLTAIRNIKEMVDRHILDSLSIAKYIEGEKLIDVGTGPGLPGIPLSIIYPEKKIHLLDSNGKKTRFLQQAKAELHLKNIEVINKRDKEFETNELYDGVLSRAFSSLEEMLEGTQHLCKENGYYFAMKGVYPESELQQVMKPYKVQKIDWPGNQVERHLVIISQKSGVNFG